MAFIDLHTHSTASDGTLSPAELVRRAKECGLAAIGLTDHDTIDGNAEAVAEGERQGLEVVAGVELSADHKGGTMHILGYFINYQSGPLRDRLAYLQRARAERNERIVARFNELGIELSLEEVRGLAGGGQIGRPHFARALMERGVVDSIEEAFERFLKKGGAAYASKKRLSPQEAIRLILASGGVPVLAHPFTLEEAGDDVGAIAAELARLGLRGLEVYYSEHSTAQELRYQKLAQSLGLLITGGTDFHGANKAGVELGVGKGNLHIPYRLLEELKIEHQRITGGGL